MGIEHIVGISSVIIVVVISIATQFPNVRLKILSFIHKLIVWIMILLVIGMVFIGIWGLYSLFVFAFALGHGFDLISLPTFLISEAIMIVTFFIFQAGGSNLTIHIYNTEHEIEKIEKEKLKKSEEDKRLKRAN